MVKKSPFVRPTGDSGESVSQRFDPKNTEIWLWSLKSSFSTFVFIWIICPEEKTNSLNIIEKIAICWALKLFSGEGKDIFNFLNASKFFEWTDSHWKRKTQTLLWFPDSAQAFIIIERMRADADAGGGGGGGGASGTVCAVLYCVPAAAHRSSLGAPGDFQRGFCVCESLRFMWLP